MTVRATVNRYIGTRRWAPTTTRNRAHILHRFATATGNPKIVDLNNDHLADWWATQRHVAPSTARGRHSCVSLFIAWGRHCGLITGDPMAGIDRPREPRRSPVTLSRNEVARLFAALPDDRAHLIATLMLGLGLRCVDVHRLEVADVDLDARFIRVTGKGGHVDVLPLPSAVAHAVRRYLRRHPAAAGPLVRAYDAPVRALSAQRMSELFAQWLRDAGVKQCKWDGRGAHALRRTLATDLLSEGCNVRQVQAVLRHESLATTQRYLRRCEAEELRPVLERDIS